MRKSRWVGLFSGKSGWGCACVVLGDYSICNMHLCMHSCSCLHCRIQDDQLNIWRVQGYIPKGSLALAICLHPLVHKTKH